MNPTVESAVKPHGCSVNRVVVNEISEISLQGPGSCKCWTCFCFNIPESNNDLITALIEPKCLAAEEVVEPFDSGLLEQEHI